MMNDNKLKKIIINKIGSPKIFVYLIIWLMILVFIGTIAQRDSGLYLVQQEYFSSWFKWFGLLPTPSAKLTMLAMFVNLSCYFFRPYIWTINKLGITITHCGVMLLLIGSGLTAIYSIEGNMIIEEGQSSNYFDNYYQKELVVIDKSNQNHDQYTVFDEHLFYRENILESSTLPFSIEILDYFINCEPIRRAYLGNENYHGMAKNFYLQPLKSKLEYEQNRAGIVFEIKGMDDVDIDGVYMLFIGQPVLQTLTIDNKEYELLLRPFRTYLPFELSLIDFKKVMHPGTNVAKSFSSDIMLNENEVSRKVLIKMNEPLRYYDYTFYQASFIEEGEIQTTVLAVVKNYGRLFPYISSVIMCIGILFHMILMLINRYRKLS